MSEADYYDGDGPACTECGGEGHFLGIELPGFVFGWHDPEKFYACPCCGGSGDRRDARYA